MPIIFSIVLFCSAFLSFSVQPILGKMLLPLVGGVPAGWIVALAFFQVSLLAGYGVSYLLGRVRVEFHALGLIVLYVAGQKFLPPHLEIDTAAIEGWAISWAVIRALAASIFVPFLALTATTSALQRVFSSTNHPTAKDPYYLFVASNVGSFVGLLSFPILLEPMMGMKMMAHWWQCLYYATTIMICGAVAFASKNKAKTAAKSEAKVKSTPVEGKIIWMWLVLSFIPCSLSMGVTTMITTDIGGLPLFWVIPLALYLLTFILAFAKKPVMQQRDLDFWHSSLVMFVVMFLGLGFGYQPNGSLLVFLPLAAMFLGVFFMIAWSCHYRLATLRPSADRLTLFYFMLALGGALAGIVHAFVIPFVLPDVIEFPLVVLLTMALHPMWKQKKQAKPIFTWAFVAALGTAVILFALRHAQVSRDLIAPFVFIFLVASLLLTFQPKKVVIIGIVVFISSYGFRYPGEVVERGRNFFGNYAVFNTESSGDPRKVRLFIHGNTIHGIEILNKKDPERYHTGYYARGNPIQDALDLTQARTMSVIGLGTGQLSCYSSKVTTDYYEIDPEVERIARTQFSYLNECHPRDVILGDGRLQLVQSGRKYDLILVDAFTSDGIPMHIITQEALEKYRDALNPGGAMLFHISNRFLDLAPPLAAGAKSVGLTAYARISKPNPKNKLQFVSRWVIIPLKQSAANTLKKRGWTQQVPAEMVWTDDKAALMSAFSMGPKLLK